MYNVGGKFTRSPFLEQPFSDFQHLVNTNIAGGFHFSQQALPMLLAGVEKDSKHSPSLIFTGATASLRAGATFSSFSVSKHGVRALSQSLAKEFGPQGVHVSHVILDGVVGVNPGAGLQQNRIDPNSVAEAYWYLHTQDNSAWTWELDLRSNTEKWT